LPSELKDEHPDVEWRKIAGLRDVLIQGYFGVDKEILWEIVQVKLPEFIKRVREIHDRL